MPARRQERVKSNAEYGLQPFEVRWMQQQRALCVAALLWGDKV